MQNVCKCRQAPGSWVQWGLVRLETMPNMGPLRKLRNNIVEDRAFNTRAPLRVQLHFLHAGISKLVKSRHVYQDISSQSSQSTIVYQSFSHFQSVWRLSQFDAICTKIPNWPWPWVRQNWMPLLGETWWRAWSMWTSRTTRVTRRLNRHELGNHMTTWQTCANHMASPGQYTSID